MNKVLGALVGVAVSLASLAAPGWGAELVNVSYDPTRELYKDFNKAFAEHWKQQGGDDVTVKLSHGGSGKQARAVIDGLGADVVTLALAYDIDVISAKAKLLPPNWQTRLPNNSSPYTSTIVLLVRKGNPKGIKDWSDLAKPGIKVIAANPKTGGGARWNYLAAWGYSLKQDLGDLAKLKDPTAAAEVAAAQTKAEAFVAAIYKNITVLDASARASTTTFAQRNIGDVLISWENEAFLISQEFGKGKFDVVIPSVSILAEPPVAVVDSVVDKKGTRKVAEAYLKYLYSPEGQEIIARHHYRPRNESVLAKYADKLPKLELFTIDDVFGGWQTAQKQHFGDGGVFDRLNAGK